MIRRIEDFLKEIHCNNESIVKVDAKRKIKVKDIDTENRNGGDIYFVVNSGGTKDREIHTFNAVFLDFDCGKDSDGNYKSLKKVETYKKLVMNSLNVFELEPSYIIETRNGYHVYWLLDNSINKVSEEQWRTCMFLLIKHFNSDPKVNNPSRLMRVPYTLWMKDKNNPFEVKMVKEIKRRYDINDIINLLQVNYNNEYKNNEMGFRSKHNKNILYILPYVSTENQRLIKDKQVNALRDILKVQPKVFNSNIECIEYITHQIDLKSFLGIQVNKGSNFNCIFHNDKKPSADIIYPSKNGEHLYVCNSNCCKFRGNIIACVERLLGCSRLQAIKFIKQVYCLSVQETQWALKTKAILDENIRLLISKEWEDSMNDIHSVIRRYYSDLIVLNEIAWKNAHIQEFSDDNDNVIFFISYKWLSTVLNKSISSMSVRVSLFTYLKLIYKIDDEKVPQRLRDKAIKYAKQNNVRDTIQFYAIPSYSYWSLVESTERARLWKERGCTIKGMSQEMLYRTFGEEIANEVYPKRKNVIPTTTANDFKELFKRHLINMISDVGYATEKDVLGRMFGIKVVKEIKEKRVLHQVLSENNLDRIRSNKEIKDKFNIKSKGYPFIIIKKSQNYCNCA